MNKLTIENTSATRIGTAALLCLSLATPGAVSAGTSALPELPIANGVLQTIKVTGTVIDETGLPVIGANVVEKGTTNGTITDMDGKFALDVP